MDFNDLPKLDKNNDLFNNVVELTSWIDSVIKKTKWSNERIKNVYAKRSSKDILEDGDVCFLNPCLDYTLIAYHILEKNNYSPKVLTEELFYRKYDSPSLHFVINLSENNSDYFLDFKEMNKVIFDKGIYKNSNPQVDTIQQFVFPHDIPFDLSSFNFSKYVFDKLNTFSFEQTIDRLILYNTDEVYQNYNAQESSSLGLYVQNLG